MAGHPCVKVNRSNAWGALYPGAMGAMGQRGYRGQEPPGYEPPSYGSQHSGSSESQRSPEEERRRRAEDEAQRNADLEALAAYEQDFRKELSPSQRFRLVQVAPERLQRAQGGAEQARGEAQAEERARVAALQRANAAQALDLVHRLQVAIGRTVPPLVALFVAARRENRLKAESAETLAQALGRALDGIVQAVVRSPAMAKKAETLCEVAARVPAAEVVPEAMNRFGERLQGILVSEARAFAAPAFAALPEMEAVVEALKEAGEAAYREALGQGRGGRLPGEALLRVAAGDSQGAPLPEPLKVKFSASLGVDVSGVRVHTGEAADRAAQAEGARAYALRGDVVLAHGEYDPSTAAGERLLAHEVAHTVQQEGGEVEAAAPRASLDATAAEAEADRAAQAMVAGQKAPSLGRVGPGRVQRQAAEADHGVGGWLHRNVYQPLQRDYDQWIAWGWTLGASWGETVPVLGEAAGTMVGLVPWVAGAAGQMMVGTAELVTPRTEEQHFLAAATLGAGPMVENALEAVSYGGLWLRCLMTRRPEVAAEIERVGVERVVAEVERRAPAHVRAAGDAAQALRPAVPKGVGNLRASVEARAEKEALGAEVPRLTPEKAAFRDSLVAEHPGLHPRVASEATYGAESIAGRGVKGADVRLLNGRGRELTVHTGQFSSRGIGPRLAEKRKQAAQGEVYLQINTPGATREGLLRIIPEIRKSGEAGGLYVRIFGPDGETWWNGTFPVLED